MGESKCVRLFRFSFLSGEDAHAFRSQWEVERSAFIFPTAVDGGPLEFEEHISQGHTTLQIFKEIQDRVADCQTSPEILKIIFMAMFNDIVWTNKGNYNECFSNQEKVKDFAPVIMSKESLLLGNLKEADDVCATSTTQSRG